MVQSHVHFDLPSHNLTNGKLWKYKSPGLTLEFMSCRILVVQKTFFNCKPRHPLTVKQGTPTTAIALSHGFVPVATHCLPSSARTYPSAQEHKTSFRPSLRTLQNCSQSPLFILQNFGMTMKEMAAEKLYINTDFTEDLEVL